MSEKNNYEQFVDPAERLLDHIKAGQLDEAGRMLDDMTKLRETQLFKELGTLTRELHEAIKSFRLDTRLSDIASTEMPDAQERLNYVITMTDQAAHRTLNAIEDSLPVVSEMASGSKTLLDQWQRFRRRELSAEEFRQLSRDVETFLGAADEQTQKLQGNLNDALMAQDYQDLTGQIIRRVINLVQEVEHSLVDLIAISGTRMGDESRKAADTEDENKGSQLEGPQIPGKETDDVVRGQDDVDDLLSSLGF